MKVNYCMFSWRFNFMGEPCLKTLPKNLRGEVHLVHNGKTREQAARMETYNKVDHVWFEPENMYHGTLLDRIMRLGCFESVTNCDWLMIVDQDIFIYDEELFTRHINEFCGMMTIPDAMLVVNKETYGDNGYRFLFRTMPFFAIKVTDEWKSYPFSWERQIVSRDEKYDSAQRLAHAIGDNRIQGRRIREDSFLKHLSSLWSWLTPDRDPRLYEQMRAFYADVIGQHGYWKIPDYEREIAQEYPLLHDALRQHESVEGFDLL